MTTDIAKTLLTYLIALVVIIGGGVLLVVPTQLDSELLLPFLTGAIGTVLGYVFGERTASASSQNMPNITVTSGPPSTATVGDDKPPGPIVGGDAP